MNTDERRYNIPDEILKWYERGLIDHQQFDDLRGRFTSDVADAIDYFNRTGLITDDQYVRLKQRYIPHEIEKWFDEGLIDKIQLKRLKRGYEQDMRSMIEQMERTGEIQSDQALRIGLLYSISGPAPPEMEGQVFMERPEIEEIVPEPSIKAPSLEETEEQWTPNDVYEIRPEKYIEKELESQGPEKSSVSQGPGIHRKLEKERTIPKKYLANKELEKRSFFKFNQLVFFITGSILFLLSVFAAVVYTWDYLDNLGRGTVFLVLSLLTLITGLFLRSKQFNRYLEVITYHASFILFGIGTVFLLSGSIDLETVKRGVVLLSLFIPIMVILIGFHFNYKSISIVAGLGYFVAVIYSLVSWPEGAMIANSLLFIIAAAVLVLVKNGLKNAEKHLLLSFFKRYSGDGIEEKVYAYSLITVSVLSYLLAQTVYVIKLGPSMGSIISASGVLMLLVLFLVSRYVKGMWLDIVIFHALVINVIIQYGVVNDYGWNGCSIPGLVITVPFYLWSLNRVRGSKEGNERTIVQVVRWSSAIWIVMFIIGLDPFLNMDVHTKNVVLLMLFSVLSLMISMAFRNHGNYIYSLTVLILTSSYFTIVKFDAAAFFVLLAPIIFGLYFKKKGHLKVFEVFFLFFVLLNFAFLWLGPIQPYPMLEEAIEPLSDWWKGTLSLLFSFIIVYWGLWTGSRYRFAISSILFVISVWLAMMDQGDLLILLLFLLTTAPYLLNLVRGKRGHVLSEKEEDIFQTALVPISLLLFITLWASPVFLPIKDHSLDWAWWKSIVTLSFSIIYMAWGVISLKKLHFLAGSLFLSTVIVINTVYRSELFSLGLLIFPVMLHFLQTTKRTKENISKFGEHVYLFLLSILTFCVFVVVLIINPMEPIVDIGYGSLQVVVWKKVLITSVLVFILLGWSLLKKVKYYYVLGSLLLVIDSMVLSLFYSELFLLLPLPLPLVLFLWEGKKGKLRVPVPMNVYLSRVGYFWSTVVMKGHFPQKKGLRGLPHFWSYRHTFPIFLLPMSMVLLLGARYPLFDVPFYLDYWRYIVGLLIFAPVFVYGVRSGLPIPSIIATGLIVITTLVISILRFELLIFLLLVPPIVVDRFDRYSKFGPGKEFKNVFQNSYLLAILLGYFVLWFVPLTPEIDLGLGTPEHLLFKGLITLFFGLLTLIEGYLTQFRSHVLIGTVLTSVSVMFISFVFFEPLIFLVLVLPPLLVLISKREGLLPRDKEVHDFFAKTLPLHNLTAFIGFILLFIPAIHPVIDLDPSERAFWLYRGVLLLIYSGAVFLFGLFKTRETFTTISGGLMASISVLFLSVVVLNEILFLVFLFLFLLEKGSREVNILGRKGSGSRYVYRSFVLVMIPAYLLIWVMPIFSFYELKMFENEYWSLKSFVALVFSFSYFLWGFNKREVSTVLISLSMASLVFFVFGLTTFSLSYIALIGVPYLVSYAKNGLKEKKMTEDKAILFDIYQNLFLFVLFLAFILLWFPEITPFSDIAPWTTTHFVYKGFLAFLFSIVMISCCILGDRPVHFLFGNLLLITTVFILTITLSELFSFLIYLVPVILIASQSIVKREGFSKVSEGLSGIFKDITGKRMESDPGKNDLLYKEFRHLFLGLAFFFFFILFLMVWLRPIKSLHSMEDTSHLYYISAIMFIFALVPLFWGIKSILRAHVLIGVLFIVIDGWVLFLSQMKGLGVVVSLFFTAAMFISGGLYFVWASKKQKAEPIRPKHRPPEKKNQAGA